MRFPRNKTHILCTLLRLISILLFNPWPERKCDTISLNGLHAKQQCPILSTRGLFSSYLAKQADRDNIFVAVGMVNDNLNLVGTNTVLSWKMLGRKY